MNFKPWSLVYICGPISLPATPEGRRANIANAVKAALYLHEHEIATIVPHLTAIPEAGYPPAPPGSEAYERILQVDLSIIARCQGLLRLPGKSAGGDREVKYAQAHNVYTFDSAEEVVSHYRAERRIHEAMLNRRYGVPKN